MPQHIIGRGRERERLTIVLWLEGNIYESPKTECRQKEQSYFLPLFWQGRPRHPCDPVFAHYFHKLLR